MKNEVQTIIFTLANILIPILKYKHYFNIRNS